MAVQISIEKTRCPSWYAASITDGKELFQFDIEAHDDFLQRSQAEILEMIAVSASDATYLISASVFPGRAIVLNVVLNKC